MRKASRTARTTGNDISRALDSARRTAVGAFRGIAAAAGVGGGMAAVASMARYIDAAKRLEAQLRLATRETGSFVQAQQDVRRIAQASRGDIEAIGNLYATFQRNARELGITQAEAARMTETVAKSFQISGASAEEAAGGLRQFLQGLQSGVLRGEEFNSVMENAPRLARALADGLGVTIGQLRSMAQEGQLTGARVRTAILSASQAIDEEFSSLPVTFDQAMTQINNAAVVAFGAFDQGGQFSQALIDFAGTGQMSFDDIARAAFETGREIRSVFEGLSDAFNPMGEGASNVFDFIRQEAEGLARGISDILGTLQDAANLAQNIAGASFDIRQMRIVYPEQYTFGDRYENTRNAVSRNAGLSQSRSIQALMEGQRPRSSRPAGGGMGGGGGGRRRGGGGRGSAEAAARRAETERVREIRDAQDFQNRLADMNADLLAARQATATAAATIATLEIEQLELERDRRNAAFASDAEEQPEAKQELARLRASQLVEANNAVVAERINAVHLREQERINAERVEIAVSDLQNAMDIEQSQSVLAETAQERRNSALRLLEYQKELERLELEAIVASTEATEAQKEIARRRLEMLGAIYQGREQGVTDSTRGPLGEFLASLPDTAAKANEALEAVAANGLQSITDGLADAIAGAKSFGDVFKNIANQIIADLIRIGLQRALVGLFGNGDSGGGLLGSLLGSIGVPGATMGGSKPGGPPIGMATGGSILVGGNSGIDRNILSLNGAPVARVSKGETVGVGQGGGSRMEIVPSPYFDVVVDGRVISTGGPMVAAGAMSARSGAQVDIARRRSRQFP